MLTSCTILINTLGFKQGDIKYHCLIRAGKLEHLSIEEYFYFMGVVSVPNCIAKLWNM